MSIFEDMVKVLRPGQLGVATIKHVNVTPDAVLMAAIRREYLREGSFAQLFVDGELMMSDTPDERRSNRDVVQAAKGHVLIAGLGIGMVLVPILAKESVLSVTVIEKYTDVITLVEPQLRRKLPATSVAKLIVIHADIFTWWPPTGTKYNTIYFDIWPSIVEDNLEEMRVLHRRARRYRALDAWVESWERKTLKASRRQRRRGRGPWGW